MSHKRFRLPHPGFTLVELLVVMAVISVLIGLLMPAVQRSREAAFRIKCANNLKQIGLAVHLHHDQHQSLPPSRLPGETLSWAWLILPNLEQQNLYNLWDPGQSLYKMNPLALNVPIPTYFCPTRRSPSGPETKPFTQPVGCMQPGGVQGAAGDYAACIGTTGADFALLLPDGTTLPPNGVFVANQGLRFADISDGLSNTLLVGEKHVPPQSFGTYPWDCTIYDGHNPACNTRAGGPGFPLAISTDDPGWKFGSYHIGICHFVFCDGSVHALLNSIDPVTLGLLANRHDGQVVTDY
jgi:prepilin-type N-terminal cleavage/methylation domain-containing protein